MRRSDLIALATALFCTVAVGADVGAAPARVVSLNVCTDQLAWLIGAPGQLISASPLAHDPRSSALAGEMADVPLNDSSAEQVALMQPNLVLAGSYTARATVQMLTGLGHRVETFQPARSLSDIRENITRMGALLGRPARAAALLAQFDARLATLSDAPETRPVVAYYLPFNETASGEGLTGDILHAAGMTTIAEALNLAPGETLPLERLVLAQPDMILVGAPYDSPAQATALLQHPALRATGKLHEIGPSAGWICGLPSTLDTVAEMRALRRAAAP